MQSDTTTCLPVSAEQRVGSFRAALDGRLVGYTIAYDLGDGVASFDQAAVHADHQNRGIGAALAEETVNWLHQHGITTILGMATDQRMHTLFDRHHIGGGPS